MFLCEQCTPMYNENPIGIVWQRDENNEFVLCKICRNYILCRNEIAALGKLTFTYTNPNSCKVIDGTTVGKETLLQSAMLAQEQQISHRERQNIWSCPQCTKNVNGRIRVWVGEHEPDDWLWCNTCKGNRKKTNEEQRAWEKSDWVRRNKAKRDKLKRNAENLVKITKLNAGCQPIGHFFKKIQ